MFGFIEHVKTNDCRWLRFAMQNIPTICIIMSFTGDNQKPNSAKRLPPLYLEYYFKFVILISSKKRKKKSLKIEKAQLSSAQVTLNNNQSMFEIMAFFIITLFVWYLVMAGILFTLGKHLHDRIISLIEEA